jgi:hypothetical protein
LIAGIIPSRRKFPEHPRKAESPRYKMKKPAWSEAFSPNTGH